MIQGLIDVNKEMARLQDKKTKLTSSLNKLNEAIANKDYVSKVPVTVQEQNADKVCGISSSSSSYVNYVLV